MLKMKIVRPVYEDEAGKLYRKATMAEALADESAVRGEITDVGEGPKQLYWFIPLVNNEAT